LLLCASLGCVQALGDQQWFERRVHNGRGAAPRLDESDRLGATGGVGDCPTGCRSRPTASSRDHSRLASRSFREVRQHIRVSPARYHEHVPRTSTPGQHHAPADACLSSVVRW
jgi:hypothetical protein